LIPDNSQSLEITDNPPNFVSGKAANEISPFNKGKKGGQKREQDMKTMLIACGAIFFIALGAYWAGGRVGAEKCRAQVAETAGANVIAMQNRISETKGRINEEAYTIGGADIRKRLREKYTIRD
jgi:hypothetical protein